MARDRGYRIQQREAHIRRRLRSIRFSYSETALILAMEQPGRAADKNPLACGNGHCSCCHMAKQCERDENSHFQRDHDRSEQRDSEAA